MKGRKCLQSVCGATTKNADRRPPYGAEKHRGPAYELYQFNKIQIEPYMQCNQKLDRAKPVLNRIDSGDKGLSPFLCKLQ